MMPLFCSPTGCNAVPHSGAASIVGTLSSGNADGDADAETGGKIGERETHKHKATLSETIVSALSSLLAL